MSTTPTAAPPQSQLIFADNPGDLPANYTLPPNSDFAVNSVVARIDGSAAAGSFVACLSIFSQDGHLMARVPTDQVFAPGDTGVVTYAPFLRKTAAAAAAGSLNALRCWTSNMALTIASGNDGRASYDNISAFDSTVFGFTNSGGRTVRVIYKKAGWYSAFAQVVPSAFAAGSVNMHFLYVGDTLSGATVATESALVGLHVGPYPTISITRYFPDEFDSLPGTTELWIAQNSGVNMTINQSNWMHVYHGAGDF